MRFGVAEIGQVIRPNHCIGQWTQRLKTSGNTREIDRKIRPPALKPICILKSDDELGLRAILIPVDENTGEFLEIFRRLNVILTKEYEQPQ